MPHYRTGEPAEVGDIVKGTGYNVKHEIIGKVIKVVEAASCNIQVAYVGIDTRVYHDPHNVPYVAAGIEYGACKDFEKIA